MKFKSIVLFSFGIFAYVSSAYANPEQIPAGTAEKTVVLHQKKPSKRPNAPARMVVVCEYGEGYLSFSLPEGVSSMTAHLYNGEDEWMGYITPYEPTANTPVFVGPYTIDCTCDDGRIFTGEILF